MSKHTNYEEEHLEHCECGCPWWMDDPWVKAVGAILAVAMAALGVFATVLWALGG